MVNSYNSRSPILLDTPEGATGGSNTIIEIADSAGHSRNHARRRRHDSPDDVIVADSPKRARVDVPVIDLTSDNEEELSTTENNTERRLYISMRARGEQMMSMLPNDARRRIRRVISLRNRSSLNPSRHQAEDHHDNTTVDTRTELSRNRALADIQVEDSVPPILVHDDETHAHSSLYNREDGFSRPSCSRVNPSRVYLPDNAPGSSRQSSLSAGTRGERTRVLTANNPANDQESSEGEAERPSPNQFWDAFQSARTARTRNYSQRRRQQLRDCLAYLSPLSINPSNPQTNADESLARNIQTAEYQHEAASPPIDEPLLSATPEFRHHRQPRRVPLFEQPLQPYIPDLLLPAMLSIWAPDSRLRHFGDSEEDREDYEALWNLTERLGQVKPKGLTKADMEEIPAFRYSAASKDFSNGSCIVCMMNYSNKEKLRRLPCNHDFHAKCIDRWLKNNRSCPVCRKEAASK